MKKLLLVPTLLAFAGCAVVKVPMPTDASRSDGIVKMTYNFSFGEIPQVDMVDTDKRADKICRNWSYKGAESFGTEERSCLAASNAGCNKTQVKITYQCVTGEIK